ncbi:hypothetical protein JXVLWARM_CDS_0087 [Burkholderia phage Bm1]
MLLTKAQAAQVLPAIAAAVSLKNCQFHMTFGDGVPSSHMIAVLRDGSIYIAHYQQFKEIESEPHQNLAAFRVAYGV